MLKWDAERDGEEYMMECEEECRKSFAFRNREGLHQLQEENKMKAKDMNAKHESYELKWEG